MSREHLFIRVATGGSIQNPDTVTRFVLTAMIADLQQKGQNWDEIPGFIQEEIARHYLWKWYEIRQIATSLKTTDQDTIMATYLQLQDLKSDQKYKTRAEQYKDSHLWHPTPELLAVLPPKINSMAQAADQFDAIHQFNTNNWPPGWEETLAHRILLLQISFINMLENPKSDSAKNWSSVYDSSLQTIADTFASVNNPEHSPTVYLAYLENRLLTEPAT